jgi:hypothetical protein
MANPDTSRSSSLDSLTTAIPVAILMLLITIALFNFRDKNLYFYYMLWFGIPISGYFISTSVNAMSQYMSCNKTDIGKAFLGGIPAAITILLGIGIASVSYCRIPVISVFAPLFTGKTVDIIKNRGIVNTNSKALKSIFSNSNSKECCTPKLILETIEKEYPILQGISYGFYIMFSVLFGLTIGNGISNIC